jgi:predicted PolB exonuclease-like 3'-5' exonuclease
MRILALDAETVPDLDAARRLLGLGRDGADEDVRSRLADYLRRPGEGADSNPFVKTALQRIVALAFVEATRAGDAPDVPLDVSRVVGAHTGRHSEASLLRRLDQSLGAGERPVIVGWNTAGFDMPLFRYRGMALSVPMPHLAFRYPSDTPRWKWQARPAPRDYWARYADDHVDLCEVLANWQGGAKAKLSEVAALLDIPGKVGMEGGQVEGAILDGRHDEVCRYCEGDTVLLYVVYLRYLLLTGDLTPAAHHASLASLATAIRARGAAGDHLAEFADLADAPQVETDTRPPVLRAV